MHRSAGRSVVISPSIETSPLQSTAGTEFQNTSSDADVPGSAMLGLVATEGAPTEFFGYSSTGNFIRKNQGAGKTIHNEIYFRWRNLAAW